MVCPRKIVPLVVVMVLGLAALDKALAEDTAPASPSTTPATPAPATPPPAAAPAPAKSDDPFGQEVTLSPKTVVYFKGSGKWDSAFETIVDGFKSVNGFLNKAGVKADGPPMTIYTSTDDNGFQFQAAIPVAAAPKDPPQGDISVGQTPAGRAYKFVHRGSYDSMDTTYEAITNFLDEKGVDAKELFVEEYVTDPVSTPEDKLVVDIYVPIK
jgi:effector-binding domain-containing protein